MGESYVCMGGHMVKVYLDKETIIKKSYELFTKIIYNEIGSNFSICDDKKTKAAIKFYNCIAFRDICNISIVDVFNTAWKKRFGNEKPFKIVNQYCYIRKNGELIPKKLLNVCLTMGIESFIIVIEKI